MVASGTGKCLGCSVTACFSSSNIHGVDFALFQPLRSQHNPSRLVFGLHQCPTIILNYITFSFILPCMSYQPNFLILFGGNFCEQQLFNAREAVKYSEMVYLLCKFRLRTHNPWLVIDHLVTLNVRFGMVSIN